MNAAKVCCIVGTDTDAGKTVVTAALLRALFAHGVKARGIKAVQTGCTRNKKGILRAPDIAVYADAAPDTPCEALNMLEQPCSPHLAAVQAGRQLDVRTLSLQLYENTLSADLTLVEGSGGVFVPLNQQETLLDLLEAISARVILVIANRLGAINHALLTIEALRSRGLTILGVIFIQPVQPPELLLEQQIHADNIETIARMRNVRVLASLPYDKRLAEADKEVRGKAWDSLAAHLTETARFLADMAAEPPDSAALLDFDEKHIWHPYTSATEPLPVWEAVWTQGNHIFLQDGTALVDGMASWWSAIHGYNHPRLTAALHEQSARMPHVMFGGLTHAPAVTLAEKLLHLAPTMLQHVFFADSGSVAVEVALKMAVQYFHASGRPRKSRFLTPRGGYHGDTLGAMSICDPVIGMHTMFSHILPQQLFVSRPECPFHARFNPASLDEIATVLTLHGHTIAAVVLEPIVQGAGGMRFYHPEYLRQLRALCNEHDILLILDEIAAGFGRTGKMFACEWADIEPDIMCVGKALTGGVMTLAATLTTARVAHGISDNGGVLMHGPTFMGNPLACAVAAASLDLLTESPWRQRITRMEALMREGLAECSSLYGVEEVRVLGGIGVVEMRQSVDVRKLQEFFVRQCGVWIRPFARLIYIMPPYTITEEELNRLTYSIKTAIEEKIWE
ncbi:MAG: adenosylmethionine--8-amino-7-oxononanoate transaminase [Desulfovibrio sp.]|nr:adenosylmethionine--8-amino-7-oxononanoate transaminase [Desulfovibrio sp.]